MRAWLVEPQLTPKAWPLVERWVASAIRKCKGQISPEFVRHCLERNTMRLWLAWEEDEQRAYGCCVTEITDSVRGMGCNLVVIAGDDFKRWAPLVSVIKADAKARGCVRLESYSRAGMVKMMKAWGWQPLHTVMELRLEDDG